MGIIRLRNVDLEQYDYFLFVDESGDAGVKFGNGSSQTFVVACFLVAKEDIKYNEELLIEIKRIIGAASDHEIKAPKLLKHKNRKQALTLYSQAKGRLYSVLAIKEKMYEEGMLDGDGIEFLSGLCHSYPLDILLNLSRNTLVVMDHMKRNDEAYFEAGRNALAPNKYDFCFSDSKSERFPLLQMVDHYAGILREFFEAYIDECFVANRCIVCDKRPNKLCKKPAKLMPRKSDGWRALKNQMYVHGEDCLLILPGSQGPKFLAMWCKK